MHTWKAHFIGHSRLARSLPSFSLAARHGVGRMCTRRAHEKEETSFMAFDFNSLFGPFQSIFESLFGWLGQLLQSILGVVGIGG